jgi:hypothetical protein
MIGQISNLRLNKQEMMELKKLLFIIIGLLLFIVLSNILFNDNGFKASNKDMVKNMVKAEANKNKIDDFRLIGLEIGSTNKDQVRTKFGDPISIEDRIRGFKDGSEVWIYEGFKLTFDNEYLLLIWVNSNQYPTYRGIKVGDSISELEKKYKHILKYESKKEIIFTDIVCSKDDNGQVYNIELNLVFRYNASNLIEEIGVSSGIM